MAAPGTGKENTLPLTPLANAFHGLMTRSNSNSLIQPIPFAGRIRGNSLSSTDPLAQFDLNVAHEPPKTPKKDSEVYKLIANGNQENIFSSPSKGLKREMSSPSKILSPSKKQMLSKDSSPQKSPGSPKARGGLKQKRIKNLMQEVQSVKDVAKLQEEVNENREKISTLQTRLTTAQKEKDSISSQLQIVEDIKQHLSQQLEAKNKQLEEYQTDTNNLTSKLTETQQTLGIALEQVAKSKNETLDHSLKRARTEVVATINHEQEKEALTNQIKDMQGENAKAIAELQEMANREKTEREKALEQEKVISELQQNCDETSRKYTALKQDFFISTCLAIKLNLSRIGRAVNIQVDELWELAQAQDVAIEQFPKFITAEIRKRYPSIAVNK